MVAASKAMPIAAIAPASSAVGPTSSASGHRLVNQAAVSHAIAASKPHHQNRWRGKCCVTSETELGAASESCVSVNISGGQDVDTDAGSERRWIGARPQYRRLLQFLCEQSDLSRQRNIHRVVMMGMGAQHRGQLLLGAHLADAGEDLGSPVRVLGHPLLCFHERRGDRGGDGTLVVDQAASYPQ